MNKIFKKESGILLTAAIGIVLAIISASCNPSMEMENSEKAIDTQEQNAVIAQYQQIGLDHNDMLKRYYTELNQSNTRMMSDSSQEKFFNEFFGISGDSRIILLPLNPSNSARSSINDSSLIEIMINEDLIHNKAAVYMTQIEYLLNNPLDTLSEMQQAITNIEYQAIMHLENEYLDEFMAYAETAKSSLIFWTENYETLTGSGLLLLDNLEARWNIFDEIEKFWKDKKNQHKLSMMALSDAAGAAAGAVAGAAIGKQLIIGAKIGAAIGATICGAASSKKGFEEDALCVFVNLSTIKNAIDKKNEMDKNKNK